MDLLSLLTEEAKKAGFPLTGIVDLDLANQDPQALFALHRERYNQWIDSGYAGKMEYLVRGRERRSDPRLVFPSAQSIFCVALPYHAQPAGAHDSNQGPRYARYLQGPDYHLKIAERLENVMKTVQALWQRTDSAPQLEWKICVDTSAILERTWAHLAGLGWIGKNTLLIHPQYGSYLFLAEVLINQTTGQAPHPLPNYCGQCTRCLTACPTQALISPGTLDSNQCISYWTLEKRGALEITAEQKNKIKNWIAGCDLCQEACPFNRKVSRQAAEEPTDSHSNATLLHHWIDLLQETSEEYRSRIKNSALSRVKPAQFSRNLAITLANTLTDGGFGEEKAMGDFLSLITRRRDQETDEVAQQEWQRCIDLAHEKIHKSETLIFSPNRSP